MSKKCTVVGGGLVGCVQALYMLKNNYEATLLERRPDIRKENISAGRSINLVLTNRGIKALEEVGIAKEILQQTVPVSGRMMHDLNGELTYQAYGVNESQQNYSVSRGDLNKTLLQKAEEAGAKISFNQLIDSIDFDQKQIHITNAQSNEKSTVDYELLFGTDGAGSAVRKSLIEKVQGTDLLEPLGVDYKELYMPAAKSGDYAIEKNALHIWPRGEHMLMALPNLDGSFTITLYLPTEGENSFKELTTKEKVQEYFKKNYPDAIELMPDYAEEFFENPTGFLGTVRCTPWHYENTVALLGDAAHAIVPFYGQGMNAGFEDCTVFNKLFTDGELDSSFAKYTQVQKPNGDAIADLAVENYRVMSEKVADPKFLLQKQIEKKLIENFPNKFNSKYAMVVYSLEPYSKAQETGVKNQLILDKLSANIDSIDQLDLEYAKKLIEP